MIQLKLKYLQFLFTWNRGHLKITKKNKGETKRNFFNVFVCSSLARACNIFILTLKTLELYFPHKNITIWKRNKTKINQITLCIRFRVKLSVSIENCFVCYVNSFALFFVSLFHLFLLLFRFDLFFYTFIFSHYRNKTGNWLTHYLSLRTSIDIVILPIGLMISTFQTDAALNHSIALVFKGNLT